VRRCATCCHTRGVAGRFSDAESHALLQKNWSVSEFFGFSTRVPEQAVLTSAGIWPKALGYRGLRCSSVRKKPSELSELTRVDLLFLVFLLRMFSIRCATFALAKDCCSGYKLFRDETWFIKRYLTTIARTEFPALFSLTRWRAEVGCREAERLHATPRCRCLQLPAPNGIGL
jgi:hypothetical protein